MTAESHIVPCPHCGQPILSISCSVRILALERELADLKEKYSDYDDVSEANCGLSVELAELRQSNDTTLAELVAANKLISSAIANIDIRKIFRWSLIDTDYARELLDAAERGRDELKREVK